MTSAYFTIASPSHSTMDRTTGHLNLIIDWMYLYFQNAMTNLMRNFKDDSIPEDNDLNTPPMGSNPSVSKDLGSQDRRSGGECRDLS